jgi:hypothetical protein
MCIAMKLRLRLEEKKPIGADNHCFMSMIQFEKTRSGDVGGKKQEARASLALSRPHVTDFNS